jgi:formylglycine-generating enzyme required for sulfatase activity
MTRWMAGVAGFAKALGLVTLCCGAAHAETTLKGCNEAFKAYEAKRGTPAACVAACTGVTLGRGPAQLATCQQAVAAQAAVRPKPPRPAPAATEDRPAPAPRRADRWRELGLVPVRIEGGSYRPGTPGATNDEAPPSYDVRVAAFELSRTEVTVAQFRKCVNEGPCAAPDTAGGCNWDKPDRANHPVNCVDWYQARMFAANGLGAGCRRRQSGSGRRGGATRPASTPGARTTRPARWP